MVTAIDPCQILTGDCRSILPTLEASSVQTCVTSPPYWGLRDYGTGQWEGGDAECDHKLTREGTVQYLGSNGKPGSNCTSWQGANRHSTVKQGGDCPKCGARRIDQQLGLEASIEEYIANMVAVFREVWRVLRDDGTLWLNMGDSYAGNSQPHSYDGMPALAEKWRGGSKSLADVSRPIRNLGSLKPKDLCMMPARLAMALQADGWYLRSEIVWAKPNPMPESVTDRPTKAHEMIYLLAKQERYFYDAEAIQEPVSDTMGAYYRRLNFDPSKQIKEAVLKAAGQKNGNDGFLNRHPMDYRNRRSVWTIATQPYAEAHFATFPEEIPKLCILAGSKLGDIVIDPFAGSGTVGQVALELGRRAILIELNSDYIKLAQDRTWVTPGFL